MAIRWDFGDVQQSPAPPTDILTVKYPRTPHLPWSKTIASDDRKCMAVHMDTYARHYNVITEKLDGENTVMSRDHIHARSCDGYGKQWQTYMLGLWNKIRYSIPEDVFICGENMFAIHSITYERLPSYFFVFAVCNPDVFFSWEYTIALCKELGLQTVPVIGNIILPGQSLEMPIPQKSAFGSVCEGYVIRNIDNFDRDVYQYNVAKCVRANHVTTDQHWSRTWKRAKLV